MRRRVAIIGGGVSGLAAAHQVIKLDPSLDVQLFEAGPRVGGVIQTIRKDGFLIEGAADNFITSIPGGIELCQDLGLGDDLIGTNPNGRGADVLSHGRLEPIPSGFMVMAPSRIWPLLSTRILSPWGKLRSGLEVFVPRKSGDDDESLKSFVCRRFGKELFDRLVQPLVGGIYTADPNRLSVAATMPRFLDMEREHGSLIRGMLAGRKASGKRSEKAGGARYSQFMTLRGGMSKLIDALRDSLPEGSVHVNTAVGSIHRRARGWKIRIGDPSCPSIDADAVIVAAPAAHAASILSSVDAQVSDELGGIEYASCAVVSLAFRRDQIGHPLGSFGFVVPQIEDHLILSCSFSSEKYEGRAPEGTVLMRVFIGGACQGGLLRLPDKELLELAQWEVAKLLDISGEPLMQHITRQKHAMPQYHVGHRARVERIEQRLQSHPTLALAGNALNGVGVPGCIDSGQKAARRVVDELGAADPSRSQLNELSAC
ncbi:protoporphyrinogen oxidase [Aporhodopirellula aestuarii]|uniref:Coproporphyrinogen III oxidase n=1 Tax=Aporhodopirellula aestuarii TaxID=2950107 RepID=A0ABT0U9M6_9BACT|nr:protoporphyrinogen oxidase [Aporhodopirellula aestuarii]MCM2373240.1 protoporphyrinogen oxidase [Aporhodopirellula aestuarii]